MPKEERKKNIPESYEFIIPATLWNLAYRERELIIRQSNGGCEGYDLLFDFVHSPFYRSIVRAIQARFMRQIDPVVTYAVDSVLTFAKLFIRKACLSKDPFYELVPFLNAIPILLKAIPIGCDAQRQILFVTLE